MIALNMEDGTLHRFRAGNTILATGVQDVKTDLNFVINCLILLER